MPLQFIFFTKNNRSLGKRKSCILSKQRQCLTACLTSKNSDSIFPIWQCQSIRIVPHQLYPNLVTGLEAVMPRERYGLLSTRSYYLKILIFAFDRTSGFNFEVQALELTPKWRCTSILSAATQVVIVTERLLPLSQAWRPSLCHS